jgi:hypothetical protein
VEEKAIHLSMARKREREREGGREEIDRFIACALWCN